MYLQVHGNEFTLRGQPIRLRGVGLGNWLNLEHLMLGIPGTEREIRAAIEAAYGRSAAERFWDRYYATYTSDADLGFVRDLGLNSIRVPVNFNLFDEANGEATPSVALRELDRVISLAESFGLLVIIDLHAAPGGQNPDWHSDNATGIAGFWQNESHRASVVRLWEKLAIRYRDNTAVAGYDLLNEPCFLDERGGAVLVTFYETCIEAIRRQDRQHVIFIEGNRYARDFSMFERNLDDQIAYSFHYYPFLQIPNELSSPNAAQKLRDSLLVETSLTHLLEDLRKPVWCGETGHAHHLANSASALKTFLEMLEALSVSWALWPLKDARAMGLISPKQDSSWMHLVRDATDDWSFWGLFSQDSLLSVCEQGDGQAYYRRLAEVTSNAHARFRAKLADVPFQTLCTAVDSFAFSECEQPAMLAELVRAVIHQVA